MRKHLPEYLHFIEPQDYSPAFYDFIPRIYDERYPLREETAEDRYYKNYQNRIGIDVFILMLRRTVNLKENDEIPV